MSTKSGVPTSLQRADMKPVWQAVRQQLDRLGPSHRGSVALPILSIDAQLVLESLLGAKPRARLDVAALEAALTSQGLGVDIDEALSRLGFSASAEAASKRLGKQMRHKARVVVMDTLKHWPEPWARDYGEWLFSSGQMVNADSVFALALLERVGSLLDVITRSAVKPKAHESLARTELAVSLFGSAHALDDGVLLERCARRALWLNTGDAQLDYQQGRGVWAAAGVSTDRVSAPVLVWRLPIKSNTALGAITTACNSANVPLHLTEIALRSHPLEFEAGIGVSEVFVVENPRLVEFAVERRLQKCLISTHGNPSTAVVHLIDALVAAGVVVNVHADFDTAGVGICRRLVERGCRPWRMSASDYEQAVQAAKSRGLTLPIEQSACGPTPWDSEFEKSFNKHRAIVHEELIIDELLGSAQ